MSSESGPKFVTDGLVLCFDAANPRSYISGATVWNDLTYNASGGTLTNGPTFSSSNGGSIVFDGVDDYVNLGNSSIITTFTQLTINCWVRLTSLPTSSNQGRVIIRGDDSYRLYWYFDSSVGNKLYFYSVDIGESTLSTSVSYPTSNFSTNTWYNINATYDGSSTNLFVNGVLVANSTGKSGTITGTNDMNLGRSNGNEYFLQGNMSLMQLYNRALSASEILQNYNATKSRFGL